MEQHFKAFDQNVSTALRVEACRAATEKAKEEARKRAGLLPRETRTAFVDNAYKTGMTGFAEMVAGIKDAIEDSDNPLLQADLLSFTLLRQAARAGIGSEVVQ